MPPADRPAVRVTDLRGKGSPPPAAVLADPTGRRAVLLHRLGRGFGALLLLWFVCLVLAGLGLLPASGVPLAGELGPRTQPPTLEAVPAPKPTSAADLRPATPAAETAVDATDAGTAAPTAPDKTETTTTKTTPVRTPTAPAVTAPGNSGSAPGQTSTTAPGNSGSAPGQTSTTGPGNSGSAPGQTSTTAPGNSGSAPGQTHTDTNPRGPGR